MTNETEIKKAKFVYNGDICWELKIYNGKDWDIVDNWYYELEYGNDLISDEILFKIIELQNLGYDIKLYEYKEE